MQAIKSVTAKPIGEKWQLTAHFEDGTSQVILKKGANRGFVQQYQFHENGPYVSIGLEDSEGGWVTFGKTIRSDFKTYHVRTIAVEVAA